MTVMVEPGAATNTGSETGAGAVLEQRSHPLLGEMEEACERVRSAAATAVWGLSDADLESSIDGCERLRAQVHHLQLGLIGEADGRALATRMGATSTTAWLRHRFRIRPGHAKSLVHTANAINDPDDEVLDYAAGLPRRTGRELVETGRALAEGLISPEHAATVDKIMSKVPREVSIEQATQAESDLAEFCREFDPGTVSRLGDYLLEMMRTDTLDDEDEHRHRNRTVHLDEHTGGLAGQLTRDGLATLRSALDPLAAPNPGADGDPDLRTPGQRLADALVELARRALASDTFANNHGISHRVMVSIGLDSLSATQGAEPDSERAESFSEEPPSDERPSDERAGEGATMPAEACTLGEASGGEAGEPTGRTGHRGVPTGGWAARPLPSWATRDTGGVAPAQLVWGSLISAGTALRMTCHSSVQRVLLDPAGAVLDVGRERRTVTPAQYAALIARDAGCAFPGCTRPPAWCIAHHIIHWAHGGPTDLNNLVMLCGHHHRVIHHDGWHVQISDHDSLPTFIPPRWVDPDQQPRRNTRPRARPVGDKREVSRSPSHGETSHVSSNGLR